MKLLNSSCRLGPACYIASKKHMWLQRQTKFSAWTALPRLAKREQYRVLDNYQYHFEVCLRHMILYSYISYIMWNIVSEFRILVSIQASTVQTCRCVIFQSTADEAFSLGCCSCNPKNVKFTSDACLRTTHSGYGLRKMGNPRSEVIPCFPTLGGLQHPPTTL